MNIETALNEFLAECEAAGRSPHTLRTYRGHIGSFARECRLELEELDRIYMRDYLIALRKRKAYAGASQKPEQDDELSPHYLASRDRHLRAFFSWCVDVG